MVPRVCVSVAKISKYITSIRSLFFIVPLAHKTFSFSISIIKNIYSKLHATHVWYHAAGAVTKKYTKEEETAIVAHRAYNGSRFQIRPGMFGGANSICCC